MRSDRCNSFLREWELDEVDRFVHPLGRDLRWGYIYHSEQITKDWKDYIRFLRERCGLPKSSSVGIAVMEKDSVHKPYLRVSGGESGNPRVYVVLEGTVLMAKMNVMNGRHSQETISADGQDIAFVVSGDICSFEALERSVIAVIDYPAFDKTQDVNEIRIVN